MLGATHEQLGLLGDALSDYLEAASLCRESCEPLLESAIASDIGFTQAKLAASDESLASALGHCQRALSQARGAGGPGEEARALNCTGEVEYHRGNLDEALELYRQAKSRWETVADARGQAETLFYEGTVHSDLSQFVEAKEKLEGAFSLWTASNDESGQVSKGSESLPTGARPPRTHRRPGLGGQRTRGHRRNLFHAGQRCAGSLLLGSGSRALFEDGPPGRDLGAPSYSG
jgi:tetratricopeptide (TPR) repeat protein